MPRNLSLKSILKKQQQLGKKSDETPRVEDSVPEEPLPWIVQDRIVEARRKGGSSTRKKTPKKPPLPSSIEGYTPSVRFQSQQQKVPVNASKHPPPRLVESATPQARKNEDRYEEEEPIVFHSLSEMMEAAGTLPKDNNDDPNVIEAELQFRVMQLEDYYEYKQANEQEQELVTISPDLEDTENNNPEESDDDFLGIFDGSDDEESEACPPPRAFLQLWDMLSQWVTPEATNYLIHGHAPVPAKTDIEMSRCVALMNLIKLHLPPQTTLAQREQLGELIRRFDYRYAMPNTAGLTKALADILLASFDDLKVEVPDVCQAVGLSPDEYTYLVRSGIRNFHHSEYPGKLQS